MEPYVRTTPRQPALGILASLFLFALLSAVLVGCAGSNERSTRKDLVETAATSGQFNTLMTAVEAAGLTETLKGQGPFTVFAPTDAAFAAIPKDQLDALLADREALKRVLTYHVVPGRVTAAQAMKLERAQTVQGQAIRIDATDTGLKVDNARVVGTDILASNGIIHVIDTVMLPN